MECGVSSLSREGNLGKQCRWWQSQTSPALGSAPALPSSRQVTMVSYLTRRHLKLTPLCAGSRRLCLVLPGRTMPPSGGVASSPSAFIQQRKRFVVPASVTWLASPTEPQNLPMSLIHCVTPGKKGQATVPSQALIDCGLAHRNTGCKVSLEK